MYQVYSTAGLFSQGQSQCHEGKERQQNWTAENDRENLLVSLPDPGTAKQTTGAPTVVTSQSSTGLPQALVRVRRGHTPPFTVLEAWLLLKLVGYGLKGKCLTQLSAHTQQTAIVPSVFCMLSMHLALWLHSWQLPLYFTLLHIGAHALLFVLVGILCSIVLTLGFLCIYVELSSFCIFVNPDSKKHFPFWDNKDNLEPWTKEGTGYGDQVSASLLDKLSTVYAWFEANNIPPAVRSPMGQTLTLSTTDERRSFQALYSWRAPGPDGIPGQTLTALG